MSAAQKAKILVVDDNRDAAESLQMLLQLAGHDVKVAYDGRQALESFAAHRPDVVFLDIGLPRISGYEVARAIRAQVPGRNTLLVALTGWGQEEDQRRAEEAGFDHHLVKPVAYEQLTELLADATL
ncbi:MAG TPA: response regulator [Burkholderiales bacterium]